MLQLHEQYRPRTWEDVVGQDHQVRRLRRLAKRGLGGRAYWISGKTGTGKTTIAKLLAAELDDSPEDIDSGKLTPAMIDDQERRMRSRNLFGGGGHVIIVNEAHGLRKDSIRQLLVTLEADRIPEHVMWIFTTTDVAEANLFGDQIDSHPLLSRCQEIRLTTVGLEKAFAERVMWIAQQEGLDDWGDLAVYEDLARSCGCNMRQMLQRVEAGDMTSDDLLSLMEG